MEFTIDSIKELINAMPDHYKVMTCDETDGLQMAAFSAGVPGMMGMTQEEYSAYLGTDTFALIFSQDRERVSKDVFYGFAHSEPFEYIYRAVHKTKGYIWVRVRASFPGILDGKKLCIASISAIALESEPYEMMLGSSAYGICAVDKNTKEILYANQTYADMIRTPIDACISRIVTEVPGTRTDIRLTDIGETARTYYSPEDDRFFDLSAVQMKWGIHDAVGIFISDVTQQRRQAIERARAAKEHLDAIMRMNPDAVSTFRVNLTRNTLGSGVSAFINLLKLQTKGSMDGYVEDALQFFPSPAEREEFAGRFCRKKLLEEFAAGNRQVSMKHHYRLTGREDHILNTIVDMVRNKATGDVEGVVYTLDVTREFYYARINERIFNNRRIGIVIINVNSSTFFMPQTSSLLDFPRGYEAQDYEAGVRQIVENWVPGEEQESYLEQAGLDRITAVLDREGRYSFRSVWEKDGQRLYVSLTCYYVDKNHEQVIGIAEDVTELTQREQEQVERYRNILRQAQEAMRDKNMLVAAAQAMFPMCISVNLTQNSYYMIEYDNFNAKKAAVSGSFDELIEVGATTMHEEERELFVRTFSRESLLEAFRRGERTVSMVHRQMGTDGNWHRNRTTVIFMEDPSTEDVLEITVTDCLDDQKKIEDELKEKEAELKLALEKAERASHAKSDFLSSMSHDIRTPLNAIMNLTRLLREELDQPDRLEEDIQKLEVAGEFLLRLINDVLDVSAIESGKAALNPQVCTYESFVSYIRGIVAPLCEEKNLKFILDERLARCDLYMDGVRFYQIFFNILSNAVKYTPPGGTVIFRTENEIIRDGILSCDFVVEDTGCGMSSDFVEKAFEPFVREDSVHAYIGTGLGLSICRKLVDMMGGTIAIESEVGRGTRVRVHLDIQIATQEQKQRTARESLLESPGSAGDGGPQRILVVEDNEINREILTRLLEKKNYPADSAENGKEALDRLFGENGEYSLVLMDIRMPVMDGLEASRRIRREEEKMGGHIPIIAITANAFVDNARECLEAGMDACLAKPISPEELYKMLEKYIHRDA